MDGTERFLTYLKQQGLSLSDGYTHEATQTLLNGMMELDVAALTQAERYARRESRRTYRNGYRRRTLYTELGAVEVAIPKLRRGTYLPGFLSDDVQAAACDFVQSAYVFDVELPALEMFVDRAGVAVEDAYTLADLQQQLVSVVQAHRNAPIWQPQFEVWLDVLRVQTERDGYSVNREIAVAVGEAENGEKSLLGHEVVGGVDAGFWWGFLHRLRDRGLHGTERVLSDEFDGVRWAVSDVFVDADWQWKPAVTMALGAPGYFDDVNSSYWGATMPVMVMAA